MLEGFTLGMRVTGPLSLGDGPQLLPASPLHPQSQAHTPATRTQPG